MRPSLPVGTDTVPPTVRPVSSASRLSASGVVGGVGRHQLLGGAAEHLRLGLAEAGVVDPGVAEVAVEGEHGDVRARHRLLEALVGAFELVGAPGDRRLERFVGLGERQVGAGEVAGGGQGEELRDLRPDRDGGEGGGDGGDGLEPDLHALERPPDRREAGDVGEGGGADEGHEQDPELPGVAGEVAPAAEHAPDRDGDREVGDADQRVRQRVQRQEPRTAGERLAEGRQAGGLQSVGKGLDHGLASVASAGRNAPTGGGSGAGRGTGARKGR